MLPVHDCIIHLTCPKMMQMLQLFESNKQKHAPGPTKIKIAYNEYITKFIIWITGIKIFLGSNKTFYMDVKGKTAVYIT